jgi:hypothetical protein
MMKWKLEPASVQYYGRIGGAWQTIGLSRRVWLNATDFPVEERWSGSGWEPGEAVARCFMSGGTEFDEISVDQAREFAPAAFV